MKVKKIQLDGALKYLTLCFYGQSGAGKSLIAGGWPQRPTLLLACDPGPFGGAQTLVQLPEEARPDIVVLRSWSDFLEVEREIRTAVEKGEYRTIVVDSLTHLQAYIAQDMLRGTPREALRIDDYRLLQARTRRLIQTLADLPSTTIFTALESYEKDELTGQMTRVPDLVGQLGRALPQYCDIVARFVPSSGYDSKGQRLTKYKAYVDGDETFVAKDRTGRLPKVIDLTGPSWDGFTPILGEGEEKDGN